MKEQYASIEKVENGWVVNVHMPKQTQSDPFDFDNKQFIFATFDEVQAKVREYFKE